MRYTQYKMSRFELKTEEPSYAFLNVIYFNGEEAFTISDSTDENIIVKDINDLNNEVVFPNRYYVDFARYLRDNEHIYALGKFINLPLFYNFIYQKTT